MAYSSYRRLFGLLIVTIACFAFGLVSQSINHLAMPGVPLYQPPFGALGNILLAILIGAGLGILLGLSETGAVSVILASFLGALLIAIASLLTGKDESVSLAHRVTALIIIFVPTAGALAPVMILFRWLIGREETQYRDAQKGRASPMLQRYAWPVAALLICAALGLTLLYPVSARAVTPSMHTLIQQGMRSKSAAELPASLRSPDVTNFIDRAQGDYTLQWDRDEGNQFAIARPAGNFYEQSTVIARFENGYLLVCVFPGTTGQPTCRDF